MEWGRGRSSPSSSSSGSRRGKKATGSSSVDKPRKPQRGLGVAQLEKIRLQSEMAKYLHHPPLGQPPPSLIHGTGSLNMEDARSSNSLPSSPSSSSYANNINVSSPYPIHPNLAIAYNGGRRSDMRYGESRSSPIIRSAPNYRGAIYGAADYSHPSSDSTLLLFEPEDTICLKGQQDLNQSVLADSSSASMNSDDPQDVDLELKL